MAQDQNEDRLVRSSGGIIDVSALEPGTMVGLPEGAQGEVVENPQDGSWVIVKYTAHPLEPDKVGQEEPVFADDLSDPA